MPAYQIPSNKTSNTNLKSHLFSARNDTAFKMLDNLLVTENDVLQRLSNENLAKRKQVYRKNLTPIQTKKKIEYLVVQK
jgi:hypothetical protein